MSFARAERRRIERAAARSQKEQLPAFVDLISWVKMRSNLSTRRAKAVILAGALKVDSHTIGVKSHTVRDHTFKEFIRFVPAEWRPRIEVVTPEGM